MTTERPHASSPIPAALEIEALVKAYQRAEPSRQKEALEALSAACGPALVALGERYGAEEESLAELLARVAKDYHAGPGHLFGPALMRGAREHLARRSVGETVGSPE